MENKQRQNEEDILLTIKSLREKKRELRNRKNNLHRRIQFIRNNFGLDLIDDPVAKSLFSTKSTKHNIDVADLRLEFDQLHEERRRLLKEIREIDVEIIRLESFIK